VGNQEPARPNSQGKKRDTQKKGERVKQGGGQRKIRRIQKTGEKEKVGTAQKKKANGQMGEILGKRRGPH